MQAKNPLLAEQAMAKPGREFPTRWWRSCCQPDAACPDALCCSVYFCSPCWFGVNSRRALGLSQAWNTALALLLIVGNIGVALLLRGWINGLLRDCVEATGEGSCTVLKIEVFEWLVYLATLYSYSVPLFYAYRRWLLRARLGITGAAWKDLLLWVCCPICALCQESRAVLKYTSKAGTEVDDVEQPLLAAPDAQLMSTAV